MKFSKIFETFSRRTGSTHENEPSLHSTFRTRVVLKCHEIFWVGISGDFWDELHKRFQYLLGRAKLSNNPNAIDIREEVLSFLQNCSNDHFLDFIEYIFSSNIYPLDSFTDDNVKDINLLFDLDDLPYSLTDFVWESVPMSFRGQTQTGTRISAWPKVIRKEDQILHNTAIEPTLNLLAQSGFASANSEFRGALEDYRKQDYADCLTKCASAFESVMKVICDRKSWPYQQSDPASTLLKTILDNSGIPTFFTGPLSIVATLRNRFSSSHGAGTQTRSISQGFAKFTINSTASSILLLADEILL